MRASPFFLNKETFRDPVERDQRLLCVNELLKVPYKALCVTIKKCIRRNKRNK